MTSNANDAVYMWYEGDMGIKMFVPCYSYLMIFRHRHLRTNKRRAYARSVCGVLGAALVSFHHNGRDHVQLDSLSKRFLARGPSCILPLLPPWASSALDPNHIAETSIRWRLKEGKGIEAGVLGVDRGCKDNGVTRRAEQQTVEETVA